MSGWAGIMGFTADGLPLIGRYEPAPGLTVAAGFNGGGFSWGVIVGKVIAGLLSGQEPGFDLAPFRPARFLDGNVAWENPFTAGEKSNPGLAPKLSKQSLSDIVADNGLGMPEPLETGWLPETPIGDTYLRRYLFNWAGMCAATAQSLGRPRRRPVKRPAPSRQRPARRFLQLRDTAATPDGPRPRPAFSMRSPLSLRSTIRPGAERCSWPRRGQPAICAHLAGV